MKSLGISGLAPCRAALLLGCGLLAAASGAAAAAEKVGEVSLAIGASRVVRATNTAKIERGAPVLVGDRIETDRGGHVHVRFVDGGYVSVRPGSRLTVESYRYDAAKPEDNAVRFRLESGVARAISGRVAESARERFRLNTPIAAIGVRGTDFVVLAEPDRVRVTVNSGAIVLAPLGDGCVPTALGPCSTPAARALTADMGRVMLEFQPQLTAPRVVPINGMPGPDRTNPPTPYEPRASAAENTQTAREATSEVLAVQAAKTAPNLPPASVTPPPLPPATLAWGRFGLPFPGDTLSVPYAEALQHGQGTVANEYYSLVRPQSTLTELVSNLGRVDFTLRDAQVHLLRGGVADPGQVDSAWLSVDFAARQFATGVAMSHAEAGSATLQTAGSVRENGIFAVRDANGWVAGSVTLDGKEAGYFFQKEVPLGTFYGITRWAR
jgi:hypothetical protein